jgi:uncharacterized integral membrane protein
MSMVTRLTLQKQIIKPGLCYSRRHAFSFRAGLVLQVLGAALLAVLYPLESPFYTVGIMLFEVGVILSAWYLFVRRWWIRMIILGSAAGGIALQFAGFYVPEQYAGMVIIGGIGLVSAGAAGIAGTEASCFRYNEGWLLMLALPGMALINLLGNENHFVNTAGFSILFLLLLSFTGKKLRQPLL